jgi:hypothetical protein
MLWGSLWGRGRIRLLGLRRLGEGLEGLRYCSSI